MHTAHVAQGNCFLKIVLSVLADLLEVLDSVKRCCVKWNFHPPNILSLINETLIFHKGGICLQLKAMFKQTSPSSVYMPTFLF